MLNNLIEDRINRKLDSAIRVTNHLIAIFQKHCDRRERFIAEFNLTQEILDKMPQGEREELNCLWVDWYKKNYPESEAKR